MGNQGWECPRCHNCYAPFISECKNCNNKSNTIENACSPYQQNLDPISSCLKGTFENPSISSYWNKDK